MIEITSNPIDTDKLLRDVASHNAGATVLFLGTTREHTGGRRTASLDYECYADMARDKLAELESEARRRWALEGCAMVHRVGHVPLGEASVAVAVSTPHRQDAFAAGQWLIDTLKQVVPIWKKENWADGTSQWVHPGYNSAEECATMTAPGGQLVDSFGRRHTNLRISVTDRCNIRCFYCMPAENVQFKPREELLTFEEIERFVRVVAPLGVNKIRLTGGEPLVRHHLEKLVAKIARH